MAEQETGTMALQWGRRHDGRFFLAVVAVAEMAGSQKKLALPLRVWLLGPEEEASLKAALAGLVVAGNGHDALLQSAVGR